MKKVLLRAPLLTNSGYGVHSRQVFEWLTTKKDIDLTVECLNWGQTSWLLDGKKENGLIEKIMSYSKKTEDKYDVTIQLQLPDEWNPNLGEFNIGMSAFVETNMCSPEWVKRCNKMDLIIVPSTFTKKVISNSGICFKDVLVVPEYFNKHISDKKTDHLLKDIKTNFNFLMISQLTDLKPERDRKNIANTIKNFCEAFEGNKDVGLILKTSIGKNTLLDKQNTNAILKNILSKYRKGKYPKVHLVHGDMKSEEIADLYLDVKTSVFLTATRGEGYGIPIVDAAASGIPVIATNWSGHLDFLNNNFLKIDYELKEIAEEKIDNRIFFKGFKWACPKDSSIKEKILDAYKNYKEHSTKALNHKNFVIKNFGKENVFNLYNEMWRKYIND